MIGAVTAHIKLPGLKSRIRTKKKAARSLKRTALKREQYGGTAPRGEPNGRRLIQFQNEIEMTAGPRLPLEQGGVGSLALDSHALRRVRSSAQNVLQDGLSGAARPSLDLWLEPFVRIAKWTVGKWGLPCNR